MLRTPVVSIDATASDPSACLAEPLSGEPEGSCTCFALGGHATLGQFSYANTTFEVPFAIVDGASHACVTVPAGNVRLSVRDGESEWCHPFLVNARGRTELLPMSLLAPPLAPPPLAARRDTASKSLGSAHVISHRKLISRIHDAHALHVKVAAAFEVPLVFGAFYLLVRLASARRRKRMGKAE